MDITLTIHIPAETARVWSALTEAQQLNRWLADAEVDLSAGAYALRGSYLPEAPAQPVTSLIAAQPPRHLEFAWRYREDDSRVELALEDAAAGCTVRVSHRGVSQRPAGCSGVTDFWVVALENLRQHVLGGEPVRYDFSQHGHHVECAVDIGASPESVFATLLDPAALDTFWTHGAVIEPRVGGRYDYGWGDGGPARILELEPQRRLVTDWSYKGEPDTVVSWQLEPAAAGTRLTLVHTGFTPGDDREDYRLGWYGFLVPLKAKLELGERWSDIKTDGYKAEAGS